ncbi:MAG TPA: DUF72 domain-containing protein [Actinomycetota bacterium]|nr:DUF72 domain-containing protein [Actinomycetota bacterium]
MGEILVGICGWTEPTLIKAGTFYPPEAKTPEERLRFYATQFPIVEVDSTYYSPPTERNAVLWLERTPQRFTFNVKAYSLLTNHPTRPDRMPKDLREALPPAQADKRNVYRDKLPDEFVDEVWKRFADALMPLHSAGKLGAVLFQFPQWFVISGYNKQYLVECAERLPDFRVAVEFRNKTWMEPRNQDETLAWLEDHDLPYVAVDMPQGLDSSIPPVAPTTARDLALVRFHSRDTAQFTAKGVSAAERFAYEYRQQELEEWVPRIEDMATSARETHVLMNNCYRDYAVNNARQLSSLLDLDE